MTRTHAERLERALDRITRRDDGLPAPQVLIRSPRLRFEYGDPTRPFHAASAGKLVTAAVIARLVDRRKLAFGTAIGAVLPAAELAGLPSAPDVDAATAVTIDHLLAQTSGFPDYFEPPRGHDTAASARSVLRDRDRRWTPRELLDEARRLPAVGRPGERFHYSDTNWVLLGRIAEEASGLPFAHLLRRDVFEPLGMAHSSTPYDATLLPDDPADIDVAPFWIGRHELSRARAVSLDWAGGNVVATPGDFERFSRAFHGGELFDARLLAHLVRPRHRLRRGIHYGAGTMTIRFGEFLPLLRGLSEPVGHVGYWATHLFHHREHDAHVVMNFHSTRRMNRSFQVHARIARILAAVG